MELEYGLIAICADICTSHLFYSVGLSKTCYRCTSDEAVVAYDALKAINDRAPVSADTSLA